MHLSIATVAFMVLLGAAQRLEGATLFGGSQWQHQQQINASSILAPVACSGSKLDRNLILKNKNIIDENCYTFTTANQFWKAENVKNPPVQVPALCLYINDMELMMNQNFDCETALSSVGDSSLFSINEVEPSSRSSPVHIKKGSPSVALGSAILIPGLAGSRLQAQLDNIEKVNFLCTKNSNWTDVWLRVSHLLPLRVDCWIENMILDYDPITGKTRNRPGVEIRAPDFGSVKSVEHLDLNHTNQSGYFSAIIDRLAALGYQRDRSILAAPYDFRKAPNELEEYFNNLDQLIERAVAIGYGYPTTLICHSMGCPNALVYLRSKSNKWRSQHIKRLITLAAPWAGSIKAIKALVVGDNLNMPLLGDTKLRQAVRSFPSIAYLLPNAEVGEMNNISSHALIQRPSQNYTANDYEQLFMDLNLPSVRNMWLATKDLTKAYEPIEDLRVDCIHGARVPTIDRVCFIYDQDFPDGPYDLQYGDGDGTVNTVSLSICSHWQKKQPSHVEHIVLPTVDHLGILDNDDVLDYITNVMLE